jgi:hypothetical protein
VWFLNYHKLDKHFQTALYLFMKTKGDGDWYALNMFFQTPPALPPLLSPPSLLGGVGGLAGVGMVKESIYFWWSDYEAFVAEIRGLSITYGEIVPCNETQSLLSLKSVLLHAGWLLPITRFPCDVPVSLKYTLIALFYFFLKVGLIIFHKKPI